jgi:hypothetical protein
VNAAGLTILLRGTAQMDSFPPAKAAFARAAGTWESYLTNPVTIVVNVDFGPTRFGQPYPDRSILGSTDAASTVVSYPLALLALRLSVTRQFEADLYTQLPVGSVNTDLGTTALIFAPRSALRALGLLPPSPGATEPIPTIGFNSNAPFDLDRSDGVATGQFDFESTAFHELGHVLGFSSTVGLTELSPSVPIVVSVLDLFRVRPGASLGAFASAQRIQSSGGAHVMFSGFGETSLSTGRPDGTGGDGNQASHWKDDAQTGFRLGAMDPTLPTRTVGYATINDLVAFDMLGYSVSYPARPNDPTNLVATATSPTEIQLTWRDNSSNESEFRLIWFINGSWSELGGIPANRTSQGLINLTPKTTYFFALLATNAGGSSAYTPTAAATTFEACAPPSITTQPASQPIASGTTATLSVAATLGVPVVSRSERNGLGRRGRQFGNIPNTPLFATSSYWVQVSNGCGSANSLTSVVTVAQLSPPSAPTNLSFKQRTSNGVVLSWTHDGNSVTAFRGYFSVNGAAFEAMNDMPADWRATQLSNVRSDLEYRFRLVAINAAGESAPSNVVVVPAYHPSRRRAVHH